jgi:ribosomal protein S18 acetylase RimI-like enzyme
MERRPASGPESFMTDRPAAKSVRFDLHMRCPTAGRSDCTAQTDVHDPDALEIERLYMHRDFQGLGLGSALMQKALDVARARGKKYVWLGVWEGNNKARAFYHKHGFYPFGSHPFVMGDDRQTDLLMRKDL